MPLQAFLTEDAAADLEALHDHILARDGVERASHVLQRIDSVFNHLTDNPHRLPGG